MTDVLVVWSIVPVVVKINDARIIAMIVLTLSICVQFILNTQYAKESPKM